MLQINFQTDIILRFGLSLQQCPVLALQNIECAIPYKLIPAADVHGEEKDGLSLWGREMEADSIVVNKLNIEGGGSGRRYVDGIVVRVAVGLTL